MWVSRSPINFITPYKWRNMKENNHCRKIASLKLKTTTAWMMTDNDILFGQYSFSNQYTSDVNVLLGVLHRVDCPMT